MSVLDGLSKEKIKALKKRPREKYLKLLEIFRLNERKLKEAYYNLLDTIREEAQAQVINNDDMVILVTGIPGVGKSTLCQIFAYEMDPSYSHRTNMSLRTEDRMRLNVELPPGAVHVMEEMSLDADRMSYRTSEGIELKRMFQVNRKKNHVIIMNLPEMDDLLSYLFDRRVRVWIHIVYKGLAMVFFAQDFMIFGNRFGISVKELRKLTKEIRTEKQVIAFVKKYLTKLPSFKGFFWFPRYTKRFTAAMYDDYNEYIKEELDKIAREKMERKSSEITYLRHVRDVIICNLRTKYGLSANEVMNLFIDPKTGRKLVSERLIRMVWSRNGLTKRGEVVQAVQKTGPVIEDEI